MDKYTNVLHLDVDDLNKLKHRGVIVVYAPWCGYCKQLKGTYEALARQHPYNFLAIDATNKDRQGDVLARQMGANGFPTILVFADGRIIGTHNGDRSEQALRQSAGI